MGSGSILSHVLSQDMFSRYDFILFSPTLTCRRGMSFAFFGFTLSYSSFPLILTFGLVLRCLVSLTRSVSCPRGFYFLGVQDQAGHGGDNDPLDVMEVGDGPLVMGTMVAVKVLG